MLNSYIQVQVPVKCTVSTQKYALRMFNDMMICPTGASFLALEFFDALIIEMRIITAVLLVFFLRQASKGRN